MARNTAPSRLASQIGKRTPFESPEQEAYLNLLRTHSLLAGEFAALFKSHGLTDAQYNVLRILRGHGGEGLATSAISEQLITRDPDVTRLIDRLEKSGHVKRERSKEDRRVVHVRITDKGRETLKRLDRPVRELHRRQLSHMSREDLETLSGLLCEARSGAE